MLLGRPVLYGLGIGGAAGVEQVLQLLQKELELAMALTGCSSLKDIGPHLLLRCSSGGLVPVEQQGSCQADSHSRSSCCCPSSLQTTRSRL